jgi:excisionase family DNA binding protein
VGSERVSRRASVRMDEISTIDEVAAYLKASKRTVHRLAVSDPIPAFKLGGTWRIRRSELDRWIAKSISTPDNSKERGNR